MNLSPKVCPLPRAEPSFTFIDTLKALAVALDTTTVFASVVHKMKHYKAMPWPVGGLCCKPCNERDVPSQLRATSPEHRVTCLCFGQMILLREDRDDRVAVQAPPVSMQKASPAQSRKPRNKHTLQGDNAIHRFIFPAYSRNSTYTTESCGVPLHNTQESAVFIRAPMKCLYLRIHRGDHHEGTGIRRVFVLNHTFGSSLRTDHFATSTFTPASLLSHTRGEGCVLSVIFY